MDYQKMHSIQKQARDNVKSLQSYMTDLQSWEQEMKRKEAALKGEFEQDLPPVRSKKKKEKPVVPVKKAPEKRISSSDYQQWEKFDVDKACEQIDMENVGPTSLDSKKSQKAKEEKLREEAQFEKERGNSFVKQEKWDEAISSYNRAIELVKDDAIYYANRGLCYLKKESLHQAESDCSAALHLDPTYVKAWQRRATAREKLGSLRAASSDLAKVIELEPQNAIARRQLEAIKCRMGTKGTKNKSSPSSTPTQESRMLTPSPKIVELTEQKPPEPKLTPDQKWMAGIGEPITVLKTVKKPPHLRSKRPLKPIALQEIQLGKTSPEKEKTRTRIKIIEIEDNKAQGDTNNNAEPIETKKDIDLTDKILEGKGDITKASQLGVEKESAKLDAEKEKEFVESVIKDFGRNAPANSVQFMKDWKYLKGHREARSDYLSLIDPTKIPTIFENALESEVLSELLHALHDGKQKFREKTVTAYLRGIGRVKRLSALAMFLSSKDKELVHKLLVHCRTVESCSENEITDLKNKFEL